MIIQEQKHQEFHPNGQLWVDGTIGIASPSTKELYEYRTEFSGYEGKAIVRLGIWTCYYSNGQMAWQLDYGAGTTRSREVDRYPILIKKYRMDGTPVVG